MRAHAILLKRNAAPARLEKLAGERVRQYSIRVCFRWPGREAHDVDRLAREVKVLTMVSA
jgi:hypothetical protein